MRLHYQLHAVAPLVTATAMLEEANKRNTENSIWIA